MSSEGGPAGVDSQLMVAARWQETLRLVFSQQNGGQSLGLLTSENLETPGLRADSSRFSGLRISFPGKPGLGTSFYFESLHFSAYIHPFTHDHTPVHT